MIFQFLLVVSWLLLAAYSKVVRTSFVLSNFNCPLSVLRMMGNYVFYYSTNVCCRYLRGVLGAGLTATVVFLWKRTFIFFQNYCISFDYHKIVVNVYVICPYLQWKTHDYGQRSVFLVRVFFVFSPNTPKKLRIWTHFTQWGDPNYLTNIKLRIFHFTLYHWPSWHNILKSRYLSLKNKHLSINSN